MTRITIVKLAALVICNGVSVASPSSMLSCTVNCLVWGSIEIHSANKSKKDREKEQNNDPKNK